MPRSPRATMIPSETSRISSKLSRPSCDSILEKIMMPRPGSPSTLRMATTSSACTYKTSVTCQSHATPQIFHTACNQFTCLHVSMLLLMNICRCCGSTQPKLLGQAEQRTLRTKDAAMRSTPWRTPNMRSSLSFSVMAGRSHLVPGKLIP